MEERVDYWGGVVKMRFGSHLYGTNTLESDLDFKGVFLPTKEQVLLGRIPKSVNLSTNRSNKKNTPDDVDTELYSLHYFIKLACAGETIAIDMLHAPYHMLDIYGALWVEIVSNRERFYTKNLRAFVGYARRQAAKYGIKGSRLNAAKQVIDLLGKYDEGSKLQLVWKYLPESEHLHMLEPSPNGLRQYQVCGKILQETMKIGYALGILNIFYENYGHRAKLAAENKGIDWKAVSHAIRAAYEVRELLKDNMVTFPRPEAEELLAIKQGKHDYTTYVAPKLDGLMSEVEELTKKSLLPEKVDRKFWDNFIVKAVEDYVL